MEKGKHGQGVWGTGSGWRGAGRRDRRHKREGRTGGKEGQEGMIEQNRVDWRERETKREMCIWVRDAGEDIELPVIKRHV